MRYNYKVICPYKYYNSLILLKLVDTKFSTENAKIKIYNKLPALPLGFCYITKNEISIENRHLRDYWKRYFIYTKYRNMFNTDNKRQKLMY